jgi:hypothetical protein
MPKADSAEVALASGLLMDPPPLMIAAFVKGCRLRGYRFALRFTCDACKRFLRSRQTVESCRDVFFREARALGIIDREIAYMLEGFCRLVLEVDTEPMNAVRLIDNTYTADTFLACIGY